MAKKAHEYQEQEDRRLCNSFLYGRSSKDLKLPTLDVRLVQYGAEYASRNPDSLFWLCKAMILGRAPMSMMESLLGKSKDFISLILPIFLDVESRLDDEAFILKQVIGSDPQQGLHDPEALWQECAYFGGFWRMLYLGAKGNRQNIRGLYRGLREQTPSLKEYLDPGKVSGDVLNVVKARMEPDTKRRIGDLRRSYLTLPGESQQKPVCSGPAMPPKNDFVARTFFEIVDERTGERKRRAAEVLEESNRYSQSAKESPDAFR